MLQRDEIYRQITEEPIGVRAAFIELFGQDIMKIAEQMETAHAVYAEIDKQAMQFQRTAYVAGLLFLGMSALAGSVQMFISGYLASGGNQLRMAVESCSLGLLCSSSRLDVYGKWDRNEYSADKAPAHARRNARTLGVDATLCDKLVKVVRFYNRHSHAGTIAIGATMSFESLGMSSLVGIFDRAKIRDYYIPEIVNRRGVAGCMAPIFSAALANLEGRN
jgi:hypothetical protein